MRKTRKAAGAIYVRVSTDKQTVENQVRESYARSRNTVAGKLWRNAKTRAYQAARAAMIVPASMTC